MSLVEYHDPDGLFKLVQPHLLARLPLKKIHWKSPLRPLRSIESLHVQFVPSAETEASLKEPAFGSSATGKDDVFNRAGSQQHSDSTFGGQQLQEVHDTSSMGYGALGRRHQIPGLRQTPSLKIYLLRCDDTDSYRSTSRGLLRAWIKSSTTKLSKSSNHENHDAFEWLILHVVLPDTAAASQTPYAESPIRATQAKEKSRKWLGSSTGTVLEKIKSDFNGSSKQELDHVAQIRMPRQNGSAQTSIAPALSIESAKEWESHWSDLMTKMKSLLLASFSLRVTQYEEDVREGDSRRALPGWNFCTFFTLKEGLAKVFESVGLIEDALVIYDELAIGLENAIRTQLADETLALGAGLLPYTKALRDIILAESNAPAGDSVEFWDAQKPLNVAGRDYRAAIVSNNVSILDFRNYAFSRQLTLMLRLAKPRKSAAQNVVNDPTKPLAQARGATSANETENIVLLGEVLDRATDFVTTIGRVLRTDLQIGCVYGRMAILYLLIAAASMIFETSELCNLVDLRRLSHQDGRLHC